MMKENKNRLILFHRPHGSLKIQEMGDITSYDKLDSNPQKNDCKWESNPFPQHQRHRSDSQGKPLSLIGF